MIVECVCGKQYQMTEANRGRKYACKVCQSVISVPRAEPTYVVPELIEEDEYQLAPEPHRAPAASGGNPFVSPQSNPRAVAATRKSQAAAARNAIRAQGVYGCFTGIIMICVGVALTFGSIALAEGTGIGFGGILFYGLIISGMFVGLKGLISMISGYE